MSSPSPRRPGFRPRADRARYHAEMADLARIRHPVLLQTLVEDTGGRRAWEELLHLVEDARGELKIRTSRAAALDLLAVQATLHISGRAGYRGINGSMAQIAEHVGRLTRHGKMSASTVRNAAAILERAGLNARGIVGRGRAREYVDTKTGETARGEDGKPLRRPAGVASLTLTVAAISFWAAGRTSTHTKPPSTTPLNLRAKPIGGESPYGTGDARSSSALAERGSARLETTEESPDSAGDGSTRPRPPPESATVGHGASSGVVTPRTGPSGPGARRGRPPPSRRYIWRPGPRDPLTYGNACQAILYDCETVLLQNGRADRDQVLAKVRRELEVGLHRTLQGELPAGAGSGVPWGDLLWRWRELPLEQRRVELRRGILPALTGHLRRLELWELPPDPDWAPVHVHQARGRPSVAPPPSRDPTPRARPPSVAPLPRAAPAPATSSRDEFLAGLDPEVRDRLLRRLE